MLYGTDKSGVEKSMLTAAIKVCHSDMSYLNQAPKNKSNIIQKFYFVHSSEIYTKLKLKLSRIDPSICSGCTRHIFEAGFFFISIISLL